MKGKAFILSSILTLIFLSLPLHAENYDLTKERIPSKMATLSFPFIENKGQVHEDVAYYAKTFGGTVFVTKDGRIVYNLPEGRKGKEKPISKVERENRAQPARAVALVETLIGATIREVKGESPSVTRVSYFKGNDPSKWQSGITTYDLVNLGEVYEGWTGDKVLQS
jgi:hypothetical protein